jgi:hypothetical protein
MVVGAFPAAKTIGSLEAGLKKSETTTYRNNSKRRMLSSSPFKVLFTKGSETWRFPNSQTGGFAYAAKR